MYLFHWFRSFLPLHNPIGFGANDFVQLTVAVVLTALILRQKGTDAISRLWKWGLSPLAAMALLFALVVGLRLALLPVYPLPTPSGADDFSYLLLADTLAHGRLANPAHPLRQFFETTFVLQTPTYSSIYALGQGFALAFGQLVFGQPWAGVVITMGLAAALVYWMLRGWTTPGWAFVGGLLAVMEFGPLNRWMNYYWGGAVSACAGCLVFGALPRLRRDGRTRDAVLLGVGLGLQMLTRPFESLFLDASVALFFLPELRRREWGRLWRIGKVAALALLPAVALQLAQDKAVTGSWTTLPYALSRYQYGVPTSFTFQDVPQPHAKLTEPQQLYYEGQSYVHGPADTVGSYFARLGSRVGFYRFFWMAPLWLALPWFFRTATVRERAWILGTIALFALGTNFYPYFFTQYIAALTCLFMLVAVMSLERMPPVAGRWLVFLCAAHFVFWYGVHAQGDPQIVRAMAPYETADSINFGDPEGRIAINRKLDDAPGKQLVFVRYFSTHGYHEWIHNAADIDGARVVWALDLPGQSDLLRSRYPERKAWLLEPDAIPPRLAAHPKTHGLFEDVP
jgi:hypothetical protein